MIFDHDLSMIKKLNPISYMHSRILGAKARKGRACAAESQKALTLVESLVAISILVISIFGPMSIVSQAIRTAYQTRDQMTAYYLAQESMEYIRNVRDTNSLVQTSAGSWLGGIDGNGLVINPPEATTPAKYQMELVPNTGNGQRGYQFVRCVGGASLCNKLNLDTATRQYGDSTVGGTIVQSIYTREIAFYAVPSDTAAAHEVLVEVTVKWSQGLSNYQYKVRDYLKNWKIAE